MKYWTNCGIRIVVFLGDGVGLGKGRTLATWASELHVVQKSLRGAGFLEHPDKSRWLPSTKIRWLGFDVDLSLVDVRLQYQMRR